VGHLDSLVSILSGTAQFLSGVLSIRVVVENEFDRPASMVFLSFQQQANLRADHEDAPTASDL